MLSSQLGRALLQSSASSADQHEARADEDGSYGELIEVIDRILEPAEDGPGSEGKRRSAGEGRERAREARRCGP